ncbi:NAD(+) synthase (glutamine-hydrolyzing) [Salvia divinorum]|uniref:Glutamine-dependent NAD(+) synthetase n=1 Tax=Salvia divinorum TaxID=28513 RepID=A0ABD1IJI1_SALDI
MRVLKVATCSLNQWAMDFDNNMSNIKESLRRAKAAGAAIRLGPELEITGYGCEDHFMEQDTITHAWECLKELVAGDWTEGMLCSFGMPVSRGPELYNCQVLCLNRKILMVRPKMWLANGGGSSELRWFTAWKQTDPHLDHLLLPPDLAQAISQPTAPFGYAYIQFLDTAVAAEICMELFSPVQVHPELALHGVEVFMNASGSIHQVQKMERRLRTITTAMSARGGVYMYCNHLGCDGARLYYDGCSCIVANGDVVAHGQQFSLKDVDMVIAQVDLDKVVNLRVSLSSYREQASCKNKVPSVFVPYKLCHSFKLQNSISTPIKVEYPSREEEIAMGAACWLWNYLRRSGASGFLLPLSGEVQTCSVAAIVACMCQLVVKEIENGDEQVKADAVRIGHYNDGHTPTNAKEFTKRIFYTIFMGTETSNETSSSSKQQSRLVAEEIGSWHLDIAIDGVVSALISLFQTLIIPRKENGGTDDIDKSAIVKIRSRTRMVVAYMLASVLPWLHHNYKSGFYLVLSSTTADQGLSGNLTKYGCSSGDINPIGSIHMKDLRAFLKWAAVNLGYSSLAQTHQTNTLHSLERGMTDEQLSTYGRLRLTLRCGPVSMFQNLCEKWGANMSPTQIAQKVKHFFKSYSINRHKMTILTPSYLVESQTCEDNRFDQRQMLYNPEWSYQFRKIDQLVQQLDSHLPNPQIQN